MASSQLCFSAYKFRVAYVHAGETRLHGAERIHTTKMQSHIETTMLFTTCGDPLGRAVADHPEAIFKTFTESPVYAAGVFKKNF